MPSFFQCLHRKYYHGFSDASHSVIHIYTHMIQTAPSSIMPAENRSDDLPIFFGNYACCWYFFFKKRSIPSFESSTLRIPNPLMLIHSACTWSKSSIVITLIFICIIFLLCLYFPVNLREHRYQFQSFCLRKSEHQVHVLYCLSCRAFYQVVDCSHHDDAVRS